MRGIKVGRSIEEVIVKRRLDIDNPLSWPPGQNTNVRILKPATRLELEDRDEGLTFTVGGAAGNRVSMHSDFGPQNNDNSDQNVDHSSNQNVDHSSNQYDNRDQNSFRDYNSMSNYCQTLRYRIKVSNEVFPKI